MFKATSLTVNATYLESLLSSVSVKSVRSVRTFKSITNMDCVSVKSVRMLNQHSSQLEPTFLHLHSEKRQRKTSCIQKTRVVLHDKEVEMEMQRKLENAKKFRKDDVFQNLFSQCKSVRSVKNIFSLLSTHIAFLLRFVFVKFFHFFKMLNFYIRCSTCLVLPSYVVKCRNLVSTSLFILKSVKPVVFLIRKKLFKKSNFFLYVVLSPFLNYLYVYLQYVRRMFSFKNLQFRTLEGVFSQLWWLFYGTRFYART